MASQLLPLDEAVPDRCLSDLFSPSIPMTCTICSVFLMATDEPGVRKRRKLQSSSKGVVPYLSLPLNPTSGDALSRGWRLTHPTTPLAEITYRTELPSYRASRPVASEREPLSHFKGATMSPLDL